jgi:predicted amidohydrolase
MKAGYIQFKPEFCNADENIKKISSLTRHKDFDLLVLPELSNSGYLFSSTEELKKSSDEIPHGNFCRALAGIAKNKNADIVSGICEKAEDKYYNSSVLVYPSGEIKTYRKVHLFHEEKKWFTPGDNLNVYEIKSGDNGKVKIGMMICFDWIFPEVSRTLALKGAQIICHPSNLVLPYCQTAMFARAVENHVYTITANRTGKEINGGKELSFTGQSVIIDPQGNYLHRGPENDEECFVIEIEPSDALNKNITSLNNLFDDRRDELYFR